MIRLISVAITCAFIGCSQPNEYRCIYSGDLSVEEQMRIVQCLEQNGWENIGIDYYEGKLFYSATRKADRQ